MAYFIVVRLIRTRKKLTNSTNNSIREEEGVIEVPFERRFLVLRGVVEHGLAAVVRQFAEDRVLLFRVIGNVVLVEEIWNERKDLILEPLELCLADMQIA